MNMIDIKDYLSKILFGVTITLVVAVMVWLYRWFNDPYSQTAAYWRTTLLDQYPDDDEDVAANAVSNQPRFIRMTIAHMRTELGLLADNAANRMVASKVARDYMKNHGVRPSHISQQFPLAVQFYFIRSSQDELLVRVGQSRGYKKYQRLANTI